MCFNIMFVRVLWRVWCSERDLRTYCERSLEDIGLEPYELRCRWRARSAAMGGS